MKKQLSPEQKEYRDKKERKIITFFAPISILGLGTWMVLSPAKPKHSHIEKATVSVVKDLWGFYTGVVFLALGAIILISTIISYRKFLKANPKPGETHP